jgi:outer membrane protein
LDWPLFTGFDRNYQVHRSKSDLARAIAERESLLQGVELEVWTAYQRVIESSQAIDAAGRFVASAEENARVAEGEYKNGVGSIIALIDAQNSRSVARTRLVQAQLDWHTAMAQFERAVGRTLATGGEAAVSGKVKP